MNWTALVIAIIVGAIVLLFVGRYLVQRQSPMPTVLGVRDGSLSSCPSSPNCVSTQDQDDGHKVSAMSFGGDEAAARAKIVSIIEGMPRSVIKANQPNYIHAEFRSFTWGFVDDVEFYLDEENGVIQSRSAARLGYDDLKANRNRYEVIKTAFEN